MSELVEKVDKITQEAICLYEQDNGIDALSKLESLLEEIFEHPPLYLGTLINLIHYEEKAGNLANVISYSKNAFSYFKKNINILMQEESMIDYIATVLIKKASSHEIQNEFQLAINDYNDVIYLYKNNQIKSKSNLVFALSSLGRIQGIHARSPKFTLEEKNKILLMAIDNFTKSLEVDPNFYPSYTFLGLAYLQIGELDKSFDMYEKGIKHPLEREPKIIPEQLLYKYHNINDLLLKNLLRKKIHLNNPKNFNDPYDCAIFRKKGVIENKPLLKVADNIRISCFSTVNDSMLLWSHYANSHKGICIGYRITEEYIKSKLLHFDEVIYQNHNKIFKDDSKMKSILNELFFIKNEAWDYENEYRMVGYKLEDDLIETPEIASITFGLNCTVEDREAILEIFANKINKIKFYEVIDDKDDLINFKVNELKL